MIKVRNLGLLLALSSVAALPACSMFGGGRSTQSSSGYSSPNYASSQPNYSSQQQAAAQEPLTPDTIRQVQQTLQQQGAYHGRVDGVWGPQSQAALRNYQQQHNLNASGQLDQQTLASLNLGNTENQSYNNGNNDNANNENGQQQPSNQAYNNGANQPSHPNQPTNNGANAGSPNTNNGNGSQNGTNNP